MEGVGWPQGGEAGRGSGEEKRGGEAGRGSGCEGDGTIFRAWDLQRV